MSAKLHFFDKIYKKQEKEADTLFYCLGQEKWSSDSGQFKPMVDLESSDIDQSGFYDFL